MHSLVLREECTSSRTKLAISDMTSGTDQNKEEASTNASSSEHPREADAPALNHLAECSPINPPVAIVSTCSGASVFLTITSLCISCTMSALDLTIVTTAVPTIVSSFQSVAGYIWIGSAYILAYTAVTPIWGSVANIWGRKPIILISLAIFLEGSLLCALAPRMEALIAGRVIQGLGGSGMGIIVNIIISDMFSLRERGLYLAIVSIVWAVGSAAGPVLGGVFITRLS